MLLNRMHFIFWLQLGWFCNHNTRRSVPSHKSGKHHKGMPRTQAICDGLELQNQQNVLPHKQPTHSKTSWLNLMLVTELNTHGKIGTKCCLSSSGLMLPFRMVVTSKAATPNGRLSIFFILVGLVSFSGGGFIPPNLTT